MEPLQWRKKAAVLVLPASMLLAACGSNTADNVDSEPIRVEQVGGDGVGVSYIYYENGTRMIDFANMTSIDDVVQVCDGPDLFEQTATGSYAAGSSIIRTAGHAACIDGKLTPDDFQLPQK
jgi:hypothetical protein